MRQVLVAISIMTFVAFAAPISCGAGTMESCQRDSTVTRISAAAEPFAVGYIQYIMYPGGCSLVDGESAVSYGYNVGASYRAWVIWSLASIPDDAEVLTVEVEHYVWPPGDPEHQTQYRALPVVPAPTDDCDLLWQELEGPVYTQYSTGTVEGWRRETLGGSAAADVAYSLTHGDSFGMAVTSVFQPNGVANFPGWSADGVDLIVTWRPDTPVHRSTWTAVKSCFLDREARLYPSMGHGASATCRDRPN